NTARRRGGFRFVEYEPGLFARSVNSNQSRPRRRQLSAIRAESARLKWGMEYRKTFPHRRRFLSMARPSANELDGLNKPNESAKFGSDRPMRVVHDQFDLCGRYGSRPHAVTKL